MPDFMETQLTILLEGLVNKENALTEIVNITDNQRTVIESGLPPAEVRGFLMEMNKEKQQFIDRVKGGDSMFETMLKEIGAELDARQHMYKPQVAELQKHIRRVMDLDVKIRLQEEKNNHLIAEHAPQAPPVPQGIKPKPKLLPPDNARVIKAYEVERKFRG
jgi:signal recognition particle GTPase